jgi:maltose alpha-D-glucosyltransferase/alpha-amylase
MSAAPSLRAARPRPGPADWSVDGSAPDWYLDAVIYELHVRAFADANGDGIGDFPGLIGKLDYLADLGVTALWLLPFYPSPLRDDGYDIADYRSIHPSYGDLRSFRRFLAAAHQRGLKVITELVINHTSDQHAWFQRARTSPPGSTERDFYVWSDTNRRYADARIIFGDFETSNWTWDHVAGAYYWHRFYSHQPDLNFDNPAVEEAVLEVLDYWLGMGVDGLRLDAVPYLYEREGTNCENLPETHAALKRLRRHVDEHHAGRMLLAEANQWPEDAAAYFGDGDECHMNFHFPVMPRLFMAVQRENRTPIIDILEQTPDPPAGCQWATFLRNHDELTLEMVTDEERDYMVRAYADDPRMRVNLGIRRRLSPLLGHDRRKIELLNALLFSLPGTPVLYYGDEIGMGDNVYLGDRDGVRTPMQWSPDRNAGFSTANPHRLYLPVITEPGSHYENVNVEAQQHQSSSLLSWTRQLIALRRRLPVLGRGAIELLDPETARVLAFVRSMPGAAPVLVTANLSRLAQQVELDLSRYVSHTPVEMFGRTRFASIGDLPYSLTLAPYGFFWLELEAPERADGGTVSTVHGSWPDVLRTRLLNRALRAWLPRQRWFGAKNAPITELHVDDVIDLGGSDVAMIVVRVSLGSEDDQRYLVPVAVVGEERLATIRRLRPDALIAELGSAGGLIDAMADEAGALAVIELVGSRRALRGRRMTVRGRPQGRVVRRVVDAARAGDGALPVHLLGVEQSNSSAIVGGQAIAKLIRRLEAGPSRDAELPRALRAGGFTHVPGLLGELAIDLRSRDGEAIGMVVHEAVANDGDVWRWTQDELARLVDEVVTERDTPVEELLTPSLELAGLLGRRTAELHRALAAATPEPHAYTLLYQRGLHQGIRSELRETQRMLERAGGPALDGDAVLARVEVLRERKLDARRIAVHGDLHLGQILWTGRDLVFIDFEGEPARALSERAIVRNPLVDVAGIVRSFDYAGRVAVATAIDRGVVPGSEHVATTRLAATWIAAVTERFWDEYQRDAVDDGLVPADPADRRMLLDVFVIAKALYEVRYELANRPGWVRWPLATLDAAHAGAAGDGPAP